MGSNWVVGHLPIAAPRRTGRWACSSPSPHWQGKTIAIPPRRSNEMGASRPAQADTGSGLEALRQGPLDQRLANPLAGTTPRTCSGQKLSLVRSSKLKATAAALSCHQRQFNDSASVVGCAAVARHAENRVNEQIELRSSVGTLQGCDGPTSCG